MRRSLLVLVRWQGEVVATRTVEQDWERQGFELPADFVSPDVQVEAYDVTRERAALPLVPPIDWRGPVGFLVSLALHVSVVVAVLLTMFFRSRDGGPKLEADDANRQAATVEEYLTRIAANEATSENKPPPQPPEIRPNRAEAEPEHVPPPALAQSEVPPPQTPPTPQADHAAKDGKGGDPEPGAPEEAVTLDLPPDALTDLLRADETTPGSASPGSGGTDTVTASKATCGASNAAKNAGPICTRTVVVTSLDVPPGCFTDTLVKPGQTGTLSFPCDGDGEAHITFGKKSFAGASRGGQVEMCAGTEYPFSDGCRWTSAQRVRGSVASGSLAFDYGEAPKVGQEKKFCARACSAHGTVSVK